MKNIFIIIDTEPPFSISYCDPKHLMFYTKYKRDARKYENIIGDPIFMGQITAELSAYVERENLNFLRENLENINYVPDQNYNPVQEMIDNFSNRYIP